MTGDPKDFADGQKVWFHGLKATVSLDAEFPYTPRPWYAIPIEIKGGGFITLAHFADLKPRGKKK